MNGEKRPRDYTLIAAWVLCGALFGAVMGKLLLPDEINISYALAFVFAIIAWRRFR